MQTARVGYITLDVLLAFYLVVRGPKAIFGVNLALGSIQCFVLVSIAPESPDSKSAECQAVTLGEVELFTF